MEMLEIMGDKDHSLLFESGHKNRARIGVTSRSMSTSEGLNIAVEKEDRISKGADFDFNNESHRRALSSGEILIDKPKGPDLWTKIDQTKIRGVTESQVDQTKTIEEKDQPSTCNSGKDEKWVSVFIGNIPPFANNRWVFENFKLMGKVVDYYVSSRISKLTKKPFGFVRFQSIEDANRAVSHFNGLRVDGFRLEVELARFPRRPVIVETDRNIQTRMGEDWSGIMRSKNGLGPSNVLNSWINPNKSFAHVLQGKSVVVAADVGSSSISRIKVKGVEKDCRWLNSAVVAKIKWGVAVGDVMKGLMGHIKGLVSIHRLGIRKMILSFTSVDDRNMAIHLDNWKGLVEDVRVWKGELVCMDKLWKLSCTGIPLTAWNSDSFRSIAEIWGSLVYIDYATSIGDDFSVANFVIETKSEFSNTDIDLLVGNDTFPVKVSGTMMEFQLGRWDYQIVGDDPMERGADLLSKSNCINVNEDFKYTAQTFFVDKSIGCGQIGQIDLSKVDNAVLGPSKKINDSAGRTEVFSQADDLKDFSPLKVLPDILSKFPLFSSDAKEEDVLGDSIQVIEGAPDTVQDDACVQISGCSNINDKLDVPYKLANGVIGAHLPDDQNGSMSGYSVFVDDQSTVGKEAVFCSKNRSLCKEKSVSISGYLGEVGKEVTAMLNLGKLLEIPNAYQFEEVVRDTTLEEIEDGSTSIGVRVKSKRKYAEKCKVQIGCRVKKG